MKRYDPDIAPTPSTWLALDEQIRMGLVTTWHDNTGISVPNMVAHAGLHTIVENQIAMNIAAVTRAMQRLQREGLSRHDALHAIGGVVAEFLFAPGLTKTTGSDEYCAAVDRLNAKAWIATYGS